MSTPFTELEAVAAGNETEAAAALGAVAAAPQEVEPGTVYTVPDGPGRVKVVDTDAYAEHPRHAKASRGVTSADSFVAYVNRHATAATEVYAHLSTSKVVAVIDSHEGSDEPAGWQGHRLSLELEHSKEWIAWSEHDLGRNPRGWFDQTEFAEFIDARALDVHEPDHATLIELALTFEAKSKADFQSSARLDNGDVKFEYVETVAAKAGQKGSIEIPKQLKLALRPYLGGPRVWVTAHFRYRVNGGALKLGFALERPENILETAFADIVTEIRDGRKETKDGVETVIHDGIGDVPLFHGRP